MYVAKYTIFSKKDYVHNTYSVKILARLVGGTASYGGSEEVLENTASSLMGEEPTAFCGALAFE